MSKARNKTTLTLQKNSHVILLFLRIMLIEHLLNRTILKGVSWFSAPRGRMRLLSLWWPLYWEQPQIIWATPYRSTEARPGTNLGQPEILYALRLFKVWRNECSQWGKWVGGRDKLIQLLLYSWGAVRRVAISNVPRVLVGHWELGVEWERFPRRAHWGFARNILDGKSRHG